MNINATVSESVKPGTSIQLTDSAIAHIRKEMNKVDGALGIRVYLETSGCSGYMYETEIVTPTGDKAPKENEEIISQDGINVYVSRKDLLVLNGTEIDFVTKGLNSMFHFINPNATAECGCGESFSVESD